MIGSAARTKKGEVVVRNRMGKRIASYCGGYRELRQKVLSDAPVEAKFLRETMQDGIFELVSREAW